MTAVRSLLREWWLRPLVLLAITSFIIYGSLYPFTFVVPGSFEDALRRLHRTWGVKTARGDLLGNLALFVPFGIAWVWKVRGGWRRMAAAAAALVTGVGLSYGLQIAQIYVPQRDATMVDVVWNIVGLVAGIGIGLLGIGFEDDQGETPSLVPLALLLAWAAFELVPFVPTIDLQLLKESAKALLVPDVKWSVVVEHAAGVLLVGEAMSRLVPPKHAWASLAAVLVVALCAKPFIVQLGVDSSAILGLGGGLIGWMAISRLSAARRNHLIAACLLMAFAFRGLVPFSFRVAAQPPSWMPFASFLHGSLLSNTRALLGTALFGGGACAALIWAGRRATSAVAIATLWAVTVEAAQMFAEGHSAEPTDPLMVLGVSLLIVAGPLSRPPIGPLVSAEPAAPAAAPPQTEGGDWAWAVPWAIALIWVVGVLVLAIRTVLRLPGVPYNVAELFLAGARLPVLVVFSLALLWVGAGAAWVARRLERQPSVVTVFWTTAVCGLVSLILLYCSVTDESIADIAGSTNINWFVINKAIWGEWARRLFLLLDSPGLVAFFERPVRFAALYGPVVVFLGYILTLATAEDRSCVRVHRAVLLGLVTLPTLSLCKAIAFDWSSTDNLNELITRDGEWGWGGGGYLYVLLFLLCANAALVARVAPHLVHVAAAVGLTVCAVPVGWWLLNLGLEQNVEKYDQVFSGAQFLLGPDRLKKLSSEVLFARWTAVQLGAVLTLAAGARLAEPVLDWIERRRQRVGNSRPVTARSAGQVAEDGRGSPACVEGMEHASQGNRLNRRMALLAWAAAGAVLLVGLGLLAVVVLARGPAALLPSFSYAVTFRNDLPIPMRLWVRRFAVPWEGGTVSRARIEVAMGAHAARIIPLGPGGTTTLKYFHSPLSGVSLHWIARVPGTAELICEGTTEWVPSRWHAAMSLSQGRSCPEKLQRP